MANLKALRTRIGSVTSTQKLTSAMKMVAAAKLRRAQMSVIASRPYAEAIADLTAKASRIPADEPLLKVGKGNTEVIVAAASNRGLAGAFNVNIARAAKKLAAEKLARGKKVKFFLIGRRLPGLLGREHKAAIIDTLPAPESNDAFGAAYEASKRLIELHSQGEIDSATVVYAFFRSALSQEVRSRSLIPLLRAGETHAGETHGGDAQLGDAQLGDAPSPECEQDENAFLQDLLPYNLAVQLNKVLLENSASEYGARTTAMDSATRNAGEMIDRLTLDYNRARQSMITGELIEIISGAEAL